MKQEKENITSYSAQLKWFPRSKEDFREILKADKHTTIEGNAAEIYTEELLVRPILGADISSFGWWFGPKGWDAYNATAVSSGRVGAEPLSSHELQIAAAIRSAVGFMTYALYTGQAFIQCPYDHNGNPVREKGTAMVPHPMATVAPLDERNLVKLDAAIAWIERGEKLLECGIQRLYANFYAREQYLWDIDCIGLYRGRVVAFDFKHKFPSNHNGAAELGANKGISRLYGKLSSGGIPVIYIVLKKPDRNQDISAVELLDRKPTEWLVCSGVNFGASAANAPNKKGTGYKGNKPQDSKMVALTDFTSVRSSDDLRNFLDKCLGLDSV